MELDGLRALAAQQKVPASVIFNVVTDALTAAGSAGAGVRVEIDNASGKLVGFDADDNPLGALDLDRAAAEVTRQAVTSWMKDSKRREIVGVWATRENTVVEAAVINTAPNGEVRFAFDGAYGVLPTGEQIPGEVLKPGDKVALLVLAANVDAREKTKLALSRRQPALIAKLMEKVTPELANGTVTITSIAREPGVRTKVALTSSSDKVDPVAAVVGAGGYRMRSVTDVLGAEKVDLVHYDPDLAKFVANSLSPAVVTSAEVLNGVKKEVLAHVPLSSMNVATGKGGINLVLAKRLTKAKIRLAPHD